MFKEQVSGDTFPELLGARWAARTAPLAKAEALIHQAELNPTQTSLLLLFISSNFFLLLLHDSDLDFATHSAEMPFLLKNRNPFNARRPGVDVAENCYWRFGFVLFCGNEQEARGKIYIKSAANAPICIQPVIM